MARPTFFRRKRKLQDRQRLRRILLETLDKRELMAVDSMSLNPGLSSSGWQSSSLVSASAPVASAAELSYTTIANSSTTSATTLSSQLAEGESVQTALDVYVAKADPSYSFQILATNPGVGYTVYDVAMTSQTWRSTAETQWNEWKHRMTIIVPSLVTSNKSLLSISGGGHAGDGGFGSSGPSGPELSFLSTLAVTTGTVVSTLSNVPYQPLQFAGESFTRTEDEIIAKSYRKYLDGGDDEWPALLPMVKSAVRAMDTVQSVAQQQNNVAVTNFVVTGASKRGWTTWLTAAADPRVTAIAPAVINVLNMDEQMEHHKRVYEGVTVGTVGGYSVAVEDYVNEGIFDEFDTPRGQDLLKIVDPYEYRDRLTMPKMMINGTGDEFFVPDSDQFFFKDLLGSKHVRYIPNAGHGLSADAFNTLGTFYASQVTNTSLPQFTWTVNPGGSIQVNTTSTPTEVRLWQATNPNSRDFRQAVVGNSVIWNSTLLTPASPNSYLAQVPRPASGHTAYMVELTYNVLGQSMKFTTEVAVVSALESTDGVRLLSVAPNSGVNFSFNQVNTLQVSPTELVLRFDRAIDTTKLNGIQVWAAGKDNVFGTANDRRITPGWIGAGDTDNVIVMRFSEPLADDLYQVRLLTTGADAAVGKSGERIITRRLDSTPSDRTIESVDFRLQLGAQILAVVPQPVDRQSNGTLNPRREIIRVYFNDDDLDVSTATNPAYYQLISTGDTVQPDDDRVWLPTGVTYDPVTDMAELVFASAIDELVPGGGTFRLRVGSRETVSSLIHPPVVTTRNELSESGSEIGGTIHSAISLGLFNDSNTTIFNGSIVTTSPFVLPVDFPGSNFEPGHRDIQDESHLISGPDSDPQITTYSYNFSLNQSYGDDSAGRPLTTSITPEQMDRVREVFEFYSRLLGIDFVETQSDGFAVVVGDMFPNGEKSGPGGVAGVAGGQLAIMDGAEDWDNSFGGSFFNVTMHEIGHLLGLLHSYDLPPSTIMGSESELALGPVEWSFPGDHDIAHGLHLHRRDNRDVDSYSFTIPAGQAGSLQLEVQAERLPNSSNLDSHLSVYRQSASGQLELVATNDQSFGNDSYISLNLSAQADATTYYVMVTASGNEDFHPEVVNTGSGGFSQGDYQLRVAFKSLVIGGGQLSIVDKDGAPIDGDADGIAGGNFNFWFRAAPPTSVGGGPRTIYVDKSYTGTTSNGTAAAPMKGLDFSAWPTSARPRPSDVVRVVSPPVGNLNNIKPYEFGRGGPSNQILSDGLTLQVPQGVTLMVDSGNVFKLQGSHIMAGSLPGAIDTSASAFQVLGTPRNTVYFTSYKDETLGLDTNSVATLPSRGDWGGIHFGNTYDHSQGRFDWERHGVFLNYVSNAEVRYGGGEVTVLSPPSVVSPIMMSESRPTLINNLIRFSADEAMSADPNSFLQTLFTTHQYQLSGPYSPDYDRVGPHIRGNRLLDNSINGLLVRTETQPGQALNTLDFSAKFDDTGVVHVISENLIINGRPGGGKLDEVVPNVALVTLNQATSVGSIPSGTNVRYKVTFVDRWGYESPPSSATGVLAVGVGGAVRLGNLPAVTGDYVGRRLWVSTDSVNYRMVTELDRSTASFTDTGRWTNSLLSNPTALSVVVGRPDARLEISPGTVVKLTGSRIELEMGSQLLAEGTADLPIIFTSRADDRFGAGGTFDTDNDGEVSNPESGNWSGIVARHLSNLSIDHALIAYGGGQSSVSGGFSGFNTVELHQAQARIANSRFHVNASGLGGVGGSRDGNGPNDASVVYVVGSQPTLVNNQFTDNSIDNTAAISINANALQATNVVDRGRQTSWIGPRAPQQGNSGPLIAGNRLLNNAINGMRVRGGVLTTETVWDDTDIVHVLQSEIIVPDFHTFGGLTLRSRVDESLVVKLQGTNAGFTAMGRPLDIPDRIGGSLRILGAPGFPVVLTSLFDDTVGAGFRPDGRQQSDTNNDGDYRPVDAAGTGGGNNSATLNSSGSTVTPPTGSGSAPFVAGRVIVGFNDNLTEQQQNLLLQAEQLNLIKRFSTINAVVVEIPDARSVASVISLLKNLPQVKYAEPDYIKTLTRRPNDPSYPEMWGLSNTGQSGGTSGADISAEQAWDLYTGSQEVVVAVIDSGVDYNHPDLQPNRWVNPGEIAGNGIDDDQNGYIDDVFGWDFGDGDADPMDQDGHGTHVAGTIAASGNNALGVTGVSWNSKIMALKGAVGAGDLPTSATIEAIQYMTMMKTRYGVNIVVSNNSYGGDQFSQAEEDAIARSIDAGILFVAAAGNDGNNNDVNPSYPDGYDLDGIISVAATDHNDRLAGFSNFGLTTVDIAAPGEDILSTVPGGGYDLNSGTSMASPHVAGVATLIAGYRPGLTVGQIKSAILRGADPIPALAGTSVTGARLNAYKSLLVSGGSIGVAPAAGDWRSIRFQPYANDRNVAMVTEYERDAAPHAGTNDVPQRAQHLGGLANNFNGGDEHLRLGFNVDGVIATPNDLDVYTFSASAGTVVWLDIDRTSGNLDSVVELIDADGRILAQSSNALAEGLALFPRHVTDDESKILSSDVLGLDANPFAPRNSWAPLLATDFQSVNPHDAGMRVILPGTPGKSSVYYVRVRSSNLLSPFDRADLQDPDKVQDGITTGAYRLQMRLRQQDEVPGSTVQYADIRYATNGIEALGMPASSPLLGHHFDNGSRNLGNIANSDRASITVGGNIASPSEFDFFDFSVQRDSIQVIDPTDGSDSISVVFDIDYADGYGRPDTALYIYRRLPTGFQLVSAGFDSNISDDQAAPGRGNDLTDLSRGSAGRRDAYIGPVELPPGDYRVVVANESRVPAPLSQFLSSTTTDGGVRTEPINSIRRISIDRFSPNPPAIPETGSGPIQISFDPDVAANRVEWTLGDVTTYVLTDEGNDSRLLFANALTGARMANVSQFPRVNDIALSPAGRLVSYQVPQLTLPLGITSTDATAGDFLQINASGTPNSTNLTTGGSTQIGSSGIQTFTTQQTNLAGPPTFEIQQRDPDGPFPLFTPLGDGIVFEALTFHTNASELMMFGVGSRGNGQTTFTTAGRDPTNNQLILGPVSNFTRNIVYRLDPLTGAAINAGPLGTPDRAGDNRVNQGAGTNKIEFGRFVSTGKIVGLAEIGGILFGVSDIGELFNASPGNGTASFGDVTSTVVVRDPQTNSPVSFAGLTAGPRNLQQRAFANLLFGTTADGTIYAFDTSGELQPVFPGFSYKTQTTGSNGLGSAVSGLDFSTLDLNLWQNTDEESLYFGFRTSSPRQQGNWDNHYQNAAPDRTYDLPGGAHGAILSHPIDLSRYSPEDQPFLTFTYTLETEDQNSDLQQDGRMRDAFRVYGAGDDGQWILLATNNTPSDGGLVRDGRNNREDELDNPINGNDSATGQNYRSQELFDVGTQRQARVSLSALAGKANVRLRFEFSTAASFHTGDPLRGGVEMIAVEGSRIADGTGFTLQPVELAGLSSQRFEFDQGLILSLPSGTGLQDGVSRLTINGNTLTFSSTLNDASHILYDPAANLSAVDIADLVRTALISKLGIPANDVSSLPGISNRLAVANLPAAGVYSTTGILGTVILGVPGVASGAVPILVSPSMTANQVREAMRTAFANAYSNPAMAAAFPARRLEAWHFHDNILKLYKFNVTGNSSSIGVTTSRAGDQFGVDLTNPNGSNFAHLDERALNNGFLGVVLDDIVIGFVERGELVINAPVEQNITFVPNTQYLKTLYDLDQIETGFYQLTVRTGADYGTLAPSSGVFTPVRDFDTNDRLSRSLGIEVLTGSQLGVADGTTFTLSDSKRQLTFEFDVTVGPNDPAAGVQQGNVAVAIPAFATANEIAVAIRNAINSSTVQNIIGISAAISGQYVNGISGRDSRIVELHGSAASDLAGRFEFPSAPFLNPIVWGQESEFGEDLGDVERPRPQGQLIISDSTITNSVEYAIVTAAGERVQPYGTVGERSYPGSVIAYPNRNLQRLAPGVVVTNNILANNTQGGLLIDGDSGLDSPVQIARVINNTFFGGNSGVVIQNGASPTILNNIFARTNTGVLANGTTTAVLGANLYQNNGTNTSGVAAGTFEVSILGSAPLFVDTNNRRFYLAAGSRAIDSSLEALQERFGLIDVKGSLGLPLSPMLAPSRDVQGQLRVDDPAVNSPSGMGGNVFKDRGAVERADFVGLKAVILNPVDNDLLGVDRDSNATYIWPADKDLNYFSILLEDINGTGPDPATVTSAAVTITENGRVLRDGFDYVFGYQANNRTLRFTPLSGAWRRDSVYEITLSNLSSRRLAVPSGQSVSDGQTITLQRSGQTLTLEFDNDGTVQIGAVPIRFTGSSSAHDLATQISFAINRANLRNSADSNDRPVSSRLESTNQIMIEDRAGLVSVSSSNSEIAITVVAAIADLAGNPVAVNRDNGLTRFTIAMPESTLDFGDALGSRIPTRLADNGARHVLLPVDANSLALGTNMDAEVDGAPTASANGDDLSGTIDDEDGIVFVGPFNRQSNPVLVQVTATDYGMLDGWIDWNMDGDFDDAEERLDFLDSPTSAPSIATSVPVKPGLNQFYVRTSQQSPELLSDQVVTTMSRFRLSVLGGLTPTGAAVGGEVEDHPVDLVGGQPPVAQADSYSVVEDTVLTVSDPNQGILSNDDDVNIIPPGDLQPGVNLFVYDENPKTPSVQPLVNVSFGTLQLNANGTFVYQPNVDFAGTDFFVYRAFDGKLISNQPVTVSIAVSPINDAPIFDIPATVDSVEDQGLASITGFVSGMLPGSIFAQDEIVQRLTPQLVALSPAAFTVQPTVDANGRLTFQIAPNVNSLNSDLRVRMWVTDDGPNSPAPNSSRSFDKIFTIQVAEINDPPQFTLSSSQITVNEDAGVIQRVGFATGLRQGPPTATDEFVGQTMQFEIMSVNNPAIFAAGQSPMFNSAGNLTFATAANKNGSAIVVVRLLDNGVSSPEPNQNMSLPQTFTITVAAANDPPEFTMPSTVTITEDQGLVTRASFATGIRPGPVGADDELGQSTEFEVEAVDPGLFAVQPSMTPNGLLTFQLAENVNSLSAQLDGRSLAVRVRLRDTGLSAPAPNNNVSPWQTLTVEATAVNDSPSSPNLPRSSLEDTALALQASELLASAVGGPTSDELPQTVRVIQVQRTTALGGQVVPVFSPDNSHILSITYQPPLNVVGNDSFVFVMQDNGTPARTGAASVQITLQPVNDPPQFAPGPNPVVLEDADTVEISGWVTGIMSGPPTATDELNSQNVSFEVTADRPELFAAGGQPTIAPSGLLTFRPAVDANGVAVIRIIAVDDGPSADPNRNRSPERLATITISPVNDAPDFTVGGTVVVDEDSGAYTQGWATGVVAAGGLLSSPATALDENSQQIQFIAQADLPALFAVQPAINSQGVLTFTPAANAFGTAMVTLVARDNGPTGGTNLSSSAPKTLTITIRPLNDAPVAVDNRFTTDENSVLRVAASGVLTNDTDIDLPLDRIRAVAGTSTSSFGAAVALAQDGSFTYDPTRVNFIQRLSTGQTLTDTFTYLIQDAAELQSNLATVTITVTGVDDPPTTVPDFFVMGPGQSRDLNILGNDVDVDTLINTASIQLVQLPAFGSVTILASGAVRYMASQGFIGQETFSYTVADMAGNRSAEALVRIVINNTPVAVDDNASTFKNQAVIVSVLSNDSDSDGTLDPDTVQIVTPPSTGTAEALPDGTIRFTPATGIVGTVSLTYQVADNSGNLSNVATVNIRVANSRWQNPALNLDVNASGKVSALDALLIINYLNTSQPRFLPDSNLVPPPYLDVNGDERVSAVDALLVINYLNDRSSGGGAEGEASTGQVAAASAPLATSVPSSVGSQVGGNSISVGASTGSLATEQTASDIAAKSSVQSSQTASGYVPASPLVATVSNNPRQAESSIEQDEDVVALLSGKSKLECSRGELVDSFFADI